MKTEDRPRWRRQCPFIRPNADKRGIDSHGVGRLKPIYVDRIKAGQINPITRIDVIRDGPTTAVLDANNGMG
ncbi:MAG: Ldh family oxidoreductase, partial [Spirochaetes bacterium]|nr:Ldh family oxidoreductase [Spirochaetota bacterium]